MKSIVGLIIVLLAVAIPATAFTQPDLYSGSPVKGQMLINGIEVPVDYRGMPIPDSLLLYKRWMIDGVLNRHCSYPTEVGSTDPKMSAVMQKYYKGQIKSYNSLALGYNKLVQEDPSNIYGLEQIPENLIDAVDNCPSRPTLNVVWKDGKKK